MNTIEQGRQFAQSLQELVSRSAWDWQRCPRCGRRQTCKYGSYVRRAWFLDGQHLTDRRQLVGARSASVRD